MLIQYFGFQDDPFRATPDLPHIFSSQTHREALASLKYGLQSNRGFVVMIAPPGMGKTTLLYRLFEELRQSTQTVFLFNIDSECEPREFLAYVLRDLGIVPGQSSSEMYEQFNNALVKADGTGRKFLIAIDEAQNLSDAVLERIRLLTNFGTSRGNPVQVILSGQPQLSDKLMQPHLAQLCQRISTNCRIDPFSPVETAAYIEFKMKEAGYDGEPLFTEGAIKLIAEATAGTPRIVNNICFNALSLCAAMGNKQVSRAMVSEVLADLTLIPHSRPSSVTAHEVADEYAPESEPQKQPMRLLRGMLVTAAAAAMVLLCLTGIFWLSKDRPLASQSSDVEKTINQEDLSTPTNPPAVADASVTSATEPALAPETVEVTVGRNQSLRDISVRYLGSFDPQNLHRIQVLNPKLRNPNHIEIGQRISIPNPALRFSTNSETSPSVERTHP